jgi:hypothetical protein
MTLYLLIFTVNPIISFYFIMNVTGRNRFLKSPLKISNTPKSIKNPGKVECFQGGKCQFWRENKKSLVIGDYQAG